MIVTILSYQCFELNEFEFNWIVVIASHPFVLSKILFFIVMFRSLRNLLCKKCFVLHDFLRCKLKFLIRL